MARKKRGEGRGMRDVIMCLIIIGQPGEFSTVRELESGGSGLNILRFARWFASHKEASAFHQKANACHG